MRPGELVRKTVLRAAKAPANLTSGAVAAAASAALWNPLPLLAWGVGSAIWVFLAGTSRRYARKVMEEERTALAARASAEREALRLEMAAVLAQPPFDEWIGGGDLPDYVARYAQLCELRERTVRQAHERTDVELATEEGIVRQLDYLMTAYLRLVKARTVYLQVLTGRRLPAGPGAQAASAGGFDGPPPEPRGSRRRRGESDLAQAMADRLEEKREQLERLRRLARNQPETATIREAHGRILARRIELLEECTARDRRLDAQLQMFPDVFAAILDRVTTSRFDAQEVTTYMGGVVEQVEETEKFVEALRPSMEEALGMEEAAAAG